MSERLEVESTYQRILTLLAGLIRASGLSQVEVDAAIGRGRGYMNHVLRRRALLNVRDFVAVVRALPVEPAALLGYAVLAPPRDEGTRSGSRDSAPPGRPAATPAGEIETLIEAILDRSLPPLGVGE